MTSEFVNVSVPSFVSCGTFARGTSSRTGTVTDGTAFRRNPFTETSCVDSVDAIHRDMILVPSIEAQFADYRKQLRSQLGSRYETVTARYRGVITMHAAQQNKSPVEYGRELIGLLKAKHRKVGPHVRAAIMAAALDVEERGLVEEYKKNRPTTPAPETLPDD